MDNLFFENPISEAELRGRERTRELDVRGYYFRDATAIIHSYPFRRLKHKTQVFFSPKNDHICTRIEHVMHVATIAATICRSLNLNPDLAWAIGLGHDLGHTPFGHVGETILNDLLKEKGGFIHELYSLRVVDKLINYGKGLNLTYAVRDGIITHCGEKFEQSIKPDFTLKNLGEITGRDYYPATWEGCVVRMSDKIAYLGRDVEDAIQLRLIDTEMIPRNIREGLGDNNSDIITNLVDDLIGESLKHGYIGFSRGVTDLILELKDFNYQKIYKNPLLSDYHTYFARIMETLFEYLNELFMKYDYDYKAYEAEKNILGTRFGDYIKKMATFYQSEDTSHYYPVADYLAGMSDDFALDCVQDIMIPKRFINQFDELLFKNRKEQADSGRKDI